MAKYKVEFGRTQYLTLEVDAEDEIEATQIANLMPKSSGEVDCDDWEFIQVAADNSDILAEPLDKTIGDRLQSAEVAISDLQNDIYYLWKVFKENGTKGD